MPTQLLFYKQAIPVSKELHGSLSIDTKQDYSFASQVNVMACPRALKGLFLDVRVTLPESTSISEGQFPGSIFFSQDSCLNNSY